MQNIYLLNIIKQNKHKFSTSEDSLVDYFLQLKNFKISKKIFLAFFEFSFFRLQTKISKLI